MSTDPPGPDALRERMEELARSYSRSLRSANRAKMTINSYLRAVRLFSAFLLDPPADAPDEGEESPAELLARHPVADEGDIRRAHVESFIAHLLERFKPSTAANRYAGLQQWFAWMAGEPDIDITVSPMLGMKPPTIPEEYPPVVPIEHIRAMLKTCDAKTFRGLRDEAIIRLFCDTGIRLSECAGLMVVEEVEDKRVPYVDLDTEQVVVYGKGRRWRVISFGARTATALDRYLRMRRRHRMAYLPNLWLSSSGHSGALTNSGFNQLVNRLCDEAGVPRVHPHLFRHTWADAQKRAKLPPEDLKRQGGWRSDRMVERYGIAEADDRAREAHRRRSFGDRI